MGNNKKIKIDRVCLLQHKHINYITCDSLMKKRPSVGTQFKSTHEFVAALTRTLPSTNTLSLATRVRDENNNNKYTLVQSGFSHTQQQEQERLQKQ